MGTQYTNCQTGEYLQNICMEMGQQKIATPVSTNNSSASVVMNIKIKQRQ